MANKNDKNNIKDERIEDVTRYGEFVSSFHQWQTLDKQRKVARHLEGVTKEMTPEAKNDPERSN